MLYRALLPAVVLVSLLASDIRAGGGPENVLLVVNSRSWASLTVANHYIALRQIPATNVLYLDWEGDIDRVDLTTFRQQLLGPVLAAMQSRRIDDHVDYVVYSSDFPWSIDASRELASLNLPKHLTPTGSLNGLTYLANLVAAGDANFLQLTSNRYFRRAPPGEVPASLGFRAWYGWSPEGQLLEAGGQRYLLSTMLAVTSGRGNSVPEVVNYLTRSAGADGTRPKGTIYFMANSDVRARTRQPGFASAISALEQLGVAAMQLEGTVPVGMPDVQGAMVGIANFDWPGSGSTIQPGAICEHLTSTGGMMRWRGSQTPLSEFLRHGAAGSSGAVIEPFAIPEKFPAPAMQVHYARGCSLGEAFYQSVHGPYQLLIVGDPLCRPWARIPEVTVMGFDTESPLRGTVVLRPAVADGSGVEVDRFQLYVDGLCVGHCARGGTLSLDTTRLPDGYHELRVAAHSADAIETQGFLVLPIQTANHGQSLELAGPADGKARWDVPLELPVRAPGAVGVALLHHSRVLGRINGSSGTFSVDPRQLGSGPVTLRAVSLGAAGPLAGAVSATLELTVEPGEALPADEDSAVQLAGGLDLLRSDGQRRALTDANSPQWLGAAGVKPGQEFELTGYVTADARDIYQFQLQHSGAIELYVGGQRVYSGESGPLRRQYIALHLERGRHRIRIAGKASDPVRLGIGFGGRGISGLDDRLFQHASSKP